MEWTEEGIILAVRRHGEHAAILSLLTRRFGRHAGLVRGGRGSRLRGILQIGNRIRATWRARLADQLGTMTCEQVGFVNPTVFARRLSLAILSAACAVAETALAEREPVPAVHDQLIELITLLAAGADDPIALRHYVLWELTLLADLGFGPDLDTRSADDRIDRWTHLAGISRPTRQTAARHDALPVPAFLVEPDAVSDLADLRHGLRLTGWFLDQCVYQAHGKRVPAARQRLAYGTAGSG
jgi:DNA repair protein RecO (recombination protein O)